MGDRGDLLRALSVAAVAAGCAGCIDFVEPELPERGAPAVAHIAVVLLDSGVLALNGTLAPGFDDDGLRRRIADPTVAAAGAVFAPLGTARDGSLQYSAEEPIDPAVATGLVEIRGPRPEAVAAAPLIAWPGMGRADRDTVMREPDGSVRLHVERAPEPATGPPPEIRQWFLNLAGEESTFRLGGDGPPPAELDIPGRFIPEGPVAARLSYQQSATLRSGEIYVALITLDVRVHWVVVEGT